MNKDQTANVQPLDFKQLSQIARVETDRFCDGCGYNLRTQAVCRDPRTEILLCRCPECGRFHPAGELTSAGRLWLQRLTMLLLAFWILLVISTAISIAVSQGAITGFTLDELTQTGRVYSPVGGRPNYMYVPQPRPSYPDWKILYAVSGLTSFGLGLAASLGAVIVCSHWRRWVYSAVVLAWPIAVALVVSYIWRQVAPHLTEWGAPYIWGHALICMLGGMVGVAIGRPLARLIVRVCLPSRLRPVLSFLWLADGKELPAGA